MRLIEVLLEKQFFDQLCVITRLFGWLLVVFWLGHGAPPHNFVSFFQWNIISLIPAKHNPVARIIAVTRLADVAAKEYRLCPDFNEDQGWRGSLSAGSSTRPTPLRPSAPLGTISRAPTPGPALSAGRS